MDLSAPLIGITLDSEPGLNQQGQGFSRYPWYAARANYASAVAKAGGMPIFLPYQTEYIQSYINLIKGLLIIGGDADVDPLFYGEKITSDKVKLKPERTRFEMELAKAAWKKDMPLLAVCGGMQLLNAVRGGSLIQHIPDSVPNALAHEQPNPRTETSHTVKLAPKSKLREWAKAEESPVNSAHHQAVKNPAEDALVAATAADGVIEALEWPKRRFTMAVQWHPEFLITPLDRAIFEHFIKACQ
ncbi:MAG: gamma-glutamyl-gamma-aminobutyrate hydrolase family protein [Dongiaceae bacterium]